MHLGVNFINIFTYKFFVRTLFRQLFHVHITYMQLKKAAEMTSHEKRARIKLMKLTLGQPDNFLNNEDCINMLNDRSACDTISSTVSWIELFNYLRQRFPTRYQFHQRFTSTFFCMKVCFWHQNFVQKMYFGFEIFGAKFLYKNHARKTLMK